MAEQTVKNQARDPRTITMILSLKERSWQDFARMWEKAVKGLDRALGSRRAEVSHGARAQLLRYITAGDPPLYRVGDEGTGGGDFTLEELLITMRRRTQKTAS